MCIQMTKRLICAKNRRPDMFVYMYIAHLAILGKKWTVLFSALNHRYREAAPLYLTKIHPFEFCLRGNITYWYQGF